MGTTGVSSGISTRSYSRNHIQQVKDICLFYVKKCSGKYDNNKLASRYVHLMSDEILKQLAGVAAQVKRYEQDPEIYQSLIDEWNESFPSMLGEIGTPKSVALKLTKQTKEIADLKEALLFEQNRSEKDVADVLKSMDAQLQAARVGIMSERKQLNATHQHQIDTFMKEINERDIELQNITTLLSNKHEVAVHKIQSEHNNLIRQYKTRISTLEETILNDRKVFEVEQKKMNGCKQEMEGKLRNEIKQLHQELSHQSYRSDTPQHYDSNMSVNSTNISLTLDQSDADTIGTTDNDDDDDRDDEVEEDVEADREEGDDHDAEATLLDSINVALSTVTAVKKKKQKKQSTPKKATARISGAVAKKVKEMKENLRAIADKYNALDAKYIALQDQQLELIQENIVIKRSYNSIRDVNEELKLALSDCLKLPGHTKVHELSGSKCIDARAKATSSSRTSTPITRLGYPDRKGVTYCQ